MVAKLKISKRQVANLGLLLSSIQSTLAFLGPSGSSETNRCPLLRGVDLTVITVLRTRRATSLDIGRMIIVVDRMYFSSIIRLAAQHTFNVPYSVAAIDYSDRS